MRWRRGTAAEWTAADPILLDGEPGYETDTGNLKVGDGSTAWTSLPYYSSAAGIPDTILDAKGDLIAASAADTAAILSVGTDGQILYADSGETTGLLWDDPPTPGGGGTELDYVERTTDLSVTATSAATANVVIDGNAVSFSGSARVKVELCIPRADYTANCFVNIWDGSTDLGAAAVGGTSTGGPTAPLYGARFLTPSAGSHTFHIKAWKTSGTTNIYGASGSLVLPIWYRITTA